VNGHGAASGFGVLALALVLAGCGSASPALPGAATETPFVPNATTTPTPKPTPTPEPVAGWPTVSRGGVTMSGAVEGWENAGRLGLLITVTGLAPGEAVSLSTAGRYSVGWVCGVAPEPWACGELGCAPAYSGTTEGQAKAAESVVAGSDGTAAARIELIAAPPAESCPEDGSAPWATPTERWEEVRVADPVHGLLLTPDTVERAIIT